MGEATKTVAAGLVLLARQKAGLSQRELAERAGVAQSEIARIETGRREPSIPTLQRIEQHQASARFENAGASPDGVAARLRRQFVERENAGRRVEAVVGRRDRFRVSDDKADARPAAEVTLGMVAVGLG